MDVTPSFGEASSGAINISSTPLTHITTRKRKHNESYLPSPQFASTFNESLITNFNDFRLEGSLPNTPDKQLRAIAKAVASPIQESRKILYPGIKIVRPERKPGPLALNKFVSNDRQHLLEKVLSNDVIMDVVFKYLSGGDLHRVSMVSDSFLRALVRNSSAYERFNLYEKIYRGNKENYVITPPGSPEKCDSPPRTSDNFNKFVRAAKKLTRSQSLTKCRKCGDVAFVENDISQCQNISACGIIYCMRCPSYSETGPQDFRDRCGHAVLRSTLGNVSNCMDDSCYFNYSSQDSGFYSENESPPKVRRNLFMTETPKALAVCNRNRVAVSQKRKQQVSFVPVEVCKEPIRRQVDCDSPPRCGYAIGSKQSKRNLKRLTR